MSQSPRTLVGRVKIALIYGCFQCTFQEPKLEVPIIYIKHISGICKDIPTKYGQKYGRVQMDPVLFPLMSILWLFPNICE